MAEPEPIELTFCEVEPNNCALEEPVNLNLEFNTTRELLDARWIIRVCAHPDSQAKPTCSRAEASASRAQFVADYAHKKKIISMPHAAHQPSSHVCRAVHSEANTALDYLSSLPTQCLARRRRRTTASAARTRWPSQRTRLTCKGSRSTC